MTRPETIAYVASTLPIALLNKKIADWGVTKIILQGETHRASYVYLQQRHPAIRLKVLPISILLGGIQLLAILLWIKLSRRRLIFFHECCCPVFDVLVKLVKPKGDYYPQVTLNSFVRVLPTEVEATKQQQIFRTFGLDTWFQYYRGDSDNNAGYFYVQVANSYPVSIEKHEVAESNDILSAARLERGRTVGGRKILLLCGQDVVDTLELKKTYSRVIELATAQGFICYLKDHPALTARLNLMDESVSTIDPHMPVELLEDDFSLIIGMASTGLLHFGDRAVSIINLLPAGEPSVSDRRKAHLLSLDGAAVVSFPASFEELLEIFIGIKCMRDINH
jgi:hypothetical protein